MQSSHGFLCILLWAIAISVPMPVPAARMHDGRQADESAAIAVVQAALDAIRDADGRKSAALQLEGFRVVSLQGPIARRHVFEETPGKAAARAATRKPGHWEVRAQSTKVLLDPNGMAVVWVPYVFYLDGVRHHCGVESWTLFRMNGAWKIINFADTDNDLDGRNPKAVCPD